jgi:hypothetical protein
MDSMPDTVLVGISALVAFAIAVAFYRADPLKLTRTTDRSTALWAVLGGVLCFWAAPLLALSQRASDAPSGADSLFMTTSVWGLAAVLTALAVPGRRPSMTVLAGAVASAAGTAGLLGSWESPSSFSPFAKFPGREGLMLVAAGVFGLGLYALAVAIRRGGARSTAVLALAAAAIAGVLAAVPFLPAAIAQAAPLAGCVYLGAFGALFALGTVHTIDSGGASRVAVALLGAPLAVMVFSLGEQFKAVYGPSPVAWRGALAGIAVLVAGGAAVLLGDGAVRPEAVRPKASSVPLALAAVAGALGVAQLATPALSALAEGGTEQPFRADWTMVGAEAAVGWLALASALMALSAVFAWRRGRPLRTWGSAAIAALVSAAALMPLAATTLHTWNRWVPADVQQTYGTEYSRLVIGALTDPVRLGAVALSVSAVVVLGVLAWRLRADGNDTMEVGNESRS